MPAVVDSNILYAWRNANDEYHDVGEGIITASKQDRFPTLHIPRVFYLETVKHVHDELGYTETLETIEMIHDAPQLSVVELRGQDYNLGKALFRLHSELDMPDAISVAYMRRKELEYIYSVDDDFDRFDDLTRLNAAISP